MSRWQYRTIRPSEKTFKARTTRAVNDGFDLYAQDYLGHHYRRRADAATGIPTDTSQSNEDEVTKDGD